jgi:hypothetical protein
MTIADQEIQAELERQAERIFGPEEPLGDEVDEAIQVLRRAQRVLKDADMMERIRARLDEDRAAVEQAAGKRS